MSAVAAPPAHSAVPDERRLSTPRWAHTGTVLGVLAIGLALVGAILQLANRGISAPGVEDFRAPELTAGLTFGLAAVLIGRKQSSNRLAWVIALVALSQSLAYVAAEYGIRALGGSTRLPLGDWAVWVSTWASFPGYWLAASLVLLLFPDGRLLSIRWRPAAAASLAGAALSAAGWAFLPYDQQDVPITFAGLSNPLGSGAAAGPLLVAGTILAGGGVALALASLVVRYRASVSDGRKQVTWVALGAAGMVVLMAAALAAGTGAFAQGILAASVVPFATGIAVAVLRYRLWDVDVVVARTLVYGALIAATVAVYGVTALLLGGVLGGRVGAPLVATVLVAVGAHPFYQRLRRRVDRFVYGERGEPYDALARLGQLLEGLGSGAELLDAVVATIAQSLLLPYVAITVDAVAVAWFGREERSVERFPLVVRGEPAGELVVSSRPGETSLSPRDRRLITDLARQAAAAVNAVTLARDAQRSRERVVSTREEERRRIRRDLHDELGPQLAGMALRLEQGRRLLVDDPAATAALLESATAELRRAVGELRRITRGLRPPSLDDMGLAGALCDVALRLTSPQIAVTVEADGVPDELPAAIESAAYGICMEAMTNSVRHSRGRTCDVRLRMAEGGLDVLVSDDGAGVDPAAAPGVGLPSMRERAEQLGGWLTIAGGPHGTTVRAWLPLR